jgi:hypothetical protein
VADYGQAAQLIEFKTNIVFFIFFILFTDLARILLYSEQVFAMKQTGEKLFLTGEEIQ